RFGNHRWCLGGVPGVRGDTTILASCPANVKPPSPNDSPKRNRNCVCNTSARQPRDGTPQGPTTGQCSCSNEPWQRKGTPYATNEWPTLGFSSTSVRPIVPGRYSNNCGVVVTWTVPRTTTPERCARTGSP